MNTVENYLTVVTNGINLLSNKAVIEVINIIVTTL